MNTATPLDIKKTNYQLIYRLFFEHEQLSKPLIVRLLGLSLPTVTGHITELESEKKIKEQGTLQSQGGRPATAYRLVEDAFVSVCVEIQLKKIKCAILNLYGEMIFHSSFPLIFENNRSYIAKLCGKINEFIQQSHYGIEQILGTGIAIQGIARKDGKSVLYGKILSFDYLNTENIQPYLVPEVKLFHDVKCAADAELWKEQQINNAVYISISEHLGGAIITNNQIIQGKNGYAGALEHLQIDPQGQRCYCGKRGCLETHSSLSALLKPEETLEQFFMQLRNHDDQHLARWQHFLQYLAKGLSVVHLLLERDIILGGEITPYLQDKDLQILQQYIKDAIPFPSEAKFIRIASVQNHATLIGAGLHYIKEYRQKSS